MHKTMSTFAYLACIAVIASGCRTTPRTGGTYSARQPYHADAAIEIVRAGDFEVQTETTAQADRLLAWNARLSVEVPCVSNAVNAVSVMTGAQGGFISDQTDGGKEIARLILRIPATVLHETLAEIESLGTVTSRNINVRDLTEQYVDVEARLKNRVLLRNRLQTLLDKAVEVKDILAIETELNRVQSDIDSMERRIRSMEGHVEYATVNVNFQRESPRKILGPLGYVFKGIWWSVEKLFVLRR